jgi:N-acyl-D-aspartate/D-glutamate deacylase
VLAEGLKWDWESFPDFLDALEWMPRTIDVAAQVPHHPLRVYVMGDRAIRREPATAEDIAEMRRLTEEAVLAGAFGFTKSKETSVRIPQPRRLGYVRVSTYGQTLDAQLDQLRADGSTRPYRETEPGVSTGLPRR